MSLNAPLNINLTTSDSLTSEGLTTATQSELLELLQTNIQQIYSPQGEPIDFSSSSPDGQLTNILATMGAIVRELITQVYNSTDPSKCQGTQQDSKYQLNYLTRNGGTYTIQNVNIVTDRTVTLQGLDGSYNDNTATAFCVSDDNGNLWYLIDTVTLQQGVTAVPFRAQNMGEVMPVIGTITTPVTIVAGVVNVSNEVGYTSLGTTQESDETFRIRRDRSTAYQGGNGFDNIVSQLLALEGVIDVNGENNNTNKVSEQGTPANSIWVIVNGGSNQDIADIIYNNIAGNGTRGAVSVDINNIAAQTITINFDRTNPVPFFLKFEIQPLFKNLTLNKQIIQDYIVQNLTYIMGEDLSTAKPTQIAAEALQSLGEIGFPVNVFVSLGGSATTDYTPGEATPATAGSTTTESLTARLTAIGNITNGTLTLNVNGTQYTLKTINFNRQANIDNFVTVLNASLEAVQATAGSTTTPNISANIANFKSVSDGVLTIEIDGQEETITDIDLQSVATIQLLQSTLTQKIQNATITVESSNQLKFTSNTTGASSNVILKETQEPQGTDIFGATYLNGTEQTEVQGTDKPACVVTSNEDNQLIFTSTIKGANSQVELLQTVGPQGTDIYLPAYLNGAEQVTVKGVDETYNNLSNIQIDVITLEDYIGTTETQTIILSYSADGWNISNKPVNISDYGITYEGTAIPGDKITINLTDGEWTNFIKCTSLANLFVTDANKIYMDLVQ